MRSALLDPRPLRLPDFRRLYLSSAVTAVGGQLTAFAVPLQLYRLTGSSLWVGLGSSAGLLPMVLAALWGGAVADTADRRRLLLLGNTGIALCSLLLWAQAAAGLASAPLLLVLIAAQQACFGANSTVRGALAPRLVPAELLPAANALQSMLSWLGGIGGPLLAGILVAFTGLGPLYLLDALALLAALLWVRKLPPLPPTLAEGAADRTDSTAPAGRSPLRDIADGFRYLAGRRILLVAYLADFTAMFLGMPVALFPQLARQGLGTAAIGVLSAALSGGAVLAGALSGSFVRVRRHGVMVTCGVCGWGLTMVGLGLVRSLWASAVLLALGGAGIVVLSVFRKTILQSAATDGMRGRLQGADTVIAAGGPRLAGLAHGAAGTALGTGWAISGGGLLVVLVMLATVAAAPAFWRYRPVPAPLTAAPASGPAPRPAHAD
ncbi:MFS transporter [Kitasatospora sp. NBC_01287]|uniref:MFS transporter n=1 Tax=Kitasatospora sp. NBC_01287 TaxID=2903573 RepID=UPI002255301B|nr:MFS transporter [Kitasatospora sp. NBC_01287]MCX4750720.1 MFS transporter [Kitasatospora sp. NBC_01287]